MSDPRGEGEVQGASPTGSGCRPADRAAARPAPAGFHPSREAREIINEMVDHFPPSDLDVGFTPFEDWRLRLWKALGATVEHARPLEEWTEEDGDVLWWKFPIEEAPYSGSPNDCGRTCLITLNLVGEEHVHSVNIGGWPGYHTHWTPIAAPDAPCDEPRNGGDATAAPGRSPAGAVAEAISEGQAPDLKALQAEIERLKADAEGWRSLWFDANRATSAWAYQACKDKIALQDSECRRVEESKRCDMISAAFERFCKRTLNITDHQKGALDCGLPRDAAARIWQRAQAHRQERLSSTPTQETPNAQG